MGVFNENLKHYRKNKGISGRQLSQLLKISYSTYMNYENRENQPPYEILCKIADILEVTTDNLLGRNGVISHSNVQEAEKETNTAKKIDFDCMDFNSKLKHYRTLSGMTGKEFAEKLGVSYGSYMNYENKKNQPSLQLVCKMADLLNLSTDKLLGHEVDKYQKWVKILEDYRNVIITPLENSKEIKLTYRMSGTWVETEIILTKDKFIEIMEQCEKKAESITEKLRLIAILATFRFEEVNEANIMIRGAGLDESNTPRNISLAGSNGHVSESDTISKAGESPVEPPPERQQ